MTSYRMRLSDKERAVGRTVYNVQHELALALLEEKEEVGLTQQALARKLGVDRSVVNRRLTGRANLTLRTFAELVWALDRELEIRLPSRRRKGAYNARRVGKQWEQLKAERDDVIRALRIAHQDLKPAIRYPVFDAGNDNWEQAEPEVTPYERVA